MKNADKGKEPVYPIHAQDLDYNENGLIVEAKNGLTKREYFVGIAMRELIGESQYINKVRYSKIAERAIALADEVLKQLEIK